MNNRNNTVNRFDKDDESCENLELKLKKENNSVIDEVSQRIKSIKMKSHLMKDKLILSNSSTKEIEGVFEKSFKVIHEAMLQLGEILKSSSGLYCWLVLFVLLVMFCVFLHTYFS